MTTECFTLVWRLASDDDVSTQHGHLSPHVDILHHLTEMGEPWLN